PLPFSTEDFRRNFDAMRPLIMSEWNLDENALENTGGDPNKVIDLIANRTNQTRARIVRQLDELREIAEGDASGIEMRLNRIVKNLEDRTKTLVHRVRDDYAPRAQETVRENMMYSLLITLGVGMFIGLIFGLSRGRHA